MEEVLVSFEVAKLANKIGIDGLNCNYIVCIGFNDMKEDRNYIHSTRNSVKGQFHLALVPTQNLLQKFLREVYNIFISVLPFQNIEDKCDLCWYYTLVNYNDVKSDDILCNENHLNASIDNFETYEEALEAGLLEALRLLTNPQS